MASGWQRLKAALWDADLWALVVLCRCVLRIAPRHYRAHVVLGRNLRRLHRREEALEVLTAALDLTDDTDASLHELAVALRGAGGYRDAASAFRTVLDADPGAADTHRELAKTLTDMGDPHAAKGHATRATDLEPRRAEHLEELGRTLMHLNDLDPAEDVLRRALEIDPKRPECQHLLARLLRLRGRYREAMEHARYAAGLPGHTRRHDAYREVLAGELRAYRDDFDATPPVTPITAPSPDIVLHVLENSLPHRTSGYTYRSHYILGLSRDHGLTTHGITRPGFPGDHGVSRPAGHDEVDGVRYHRVRIDGPQGYNDQPLDRYLRHYARAVADRASELNAGLLHAASNFKNAVAAGAAARALAIPWVYEHRGIWEDTLVSKGIIDESCERYRYYREMETRCMHDAHAVVTISHTLEAELHERGIAPEKIFVVPNAVEVDKLPVVERDASLARRLGIGDARTVGYVGSFIAYEGLDLLIHAFSRMRADHLDARLVLVGDGEVRGSLEALAHDLGVADRVFFTGRVPHQEVLAYYSLIDVFAVPRHPFRVCRLVTPIKPYEAMSTGRTVVVSDVPALAEMVADGVTGAHFRAGDADDLVRVLEGLLVDPQRRRDLAAAGASWVREHRTWEQAVATYPAVYDYARAAAGSDSR